MTDPFVDLADGERIRFMWDYGVRVPLWTDYGLVDDDPEWLRRELRLSDGLIRDLAAWGAAMEYLDAHPPQRDPQVYRDLDQRARVLVERLRAEVGTRFRIVYKPWR